VKRIKTAQPPDQAVYFNQLPGRPLLNLRHRVRRHSDELDAAVPKGETLPLTYPLSFLH
jgi:hypothetical protein